MGHIPVLLNEVLEAFKEKKLKTFFEGTVGLGGHAKALLEAHPEIERYLACDRDPKALEKAQKRLVAWGKKVEWIHGPYDRLSDYLEEKGMDALGGVFLDIGVSSMQLDEAERGFSFRFDAPLDMRMDPSEGKTAADLLNTLPEKELARIFFEYGEETRSRPAAKAVVLARKKKKIRTTQELVRILEPVLRKGKIHFATRVFQALRIAVNDELGQLERGLKSAIDKLEVGGILAVISFHSLEDRIVKCAIREDKRCKAMTKKPLSASPKEARENPRSRSAKLRVAQKIEEMA